ncbi:MAG: FUSC family protein [Acetobacteraceae bacterium]|nr:FUSC family protein [Acetobacteraceae bacterium]
MAQFGVDALSGRLDTTSFTNDRRRLARDGAALDAMFHQARYETGSRAALLWLPALRDRARWVPAIVTAAAERIATLRAADPAALNALAPLLDEVTSWMARTIETAPQAGTDLSARRLLIRLEQEQAAATGDWPSLDRSGRILAAEPAGPEQEPQIRRPGSTDPLLVALSGVAAALAIIGTCAFWILTASPAGSIAALMAAVASSIFAQLDDPAPAIARFISGNAASVVVAGIYLFAVLPAIDGFPLLIVALGAFFLPAAAFQAVPSLTARLTPVTLNTFAMMSLQENYAADFPSLLESGLAMLLGIGFALWATRLVRSFGISLRVSRLVQADRRDLARLAEGRHPADLRRIAAAMLDRFEAVAARLRRPGIGGPSGCAERAAAEGDDGPPRIPGTPPGRGGPDRRGGPGARAGAGRGNARSPRCGAGRPHRLRGSAGTVRRAGALGAADGVVPGGTATCGRTGPCHAAQPGQGGRMTGEIDIFGVFFPALLVWTVLALALSALLRRGIERLGLYRFVWHPPLFDLALFVILLGGVAAAMSWWATP